MGLCVASSMTFQNMPFESISSLRAVFLKTRAVFSKKPILKTISSLQDQHKLIWKARIARQRAYFWALLIRSRNFNGNFLQNQPFVCNRTNSNYQGKCYLQTQDCFTHLGSFAGPSPQEHFCSQKGEVWMREPFPFLGAKDVHERTHCWEDTQYWHISEPTWGITKPAGESLHGP